MGNIKSNIWQTIKNIIDIWGIIQFIFGLGSEGAAMLSALAKLPYWVFLGFIVIGVLLIISSIARTILNYRRWIRTKDLRLVLFDASLILEKLHYRMKEMADKKAKSLDLNKCLKVFITFSREKEALELFQDIVNKALNNSLITRIKTIIVKNKRARQTRKMLTLFVGMFDTEGQGIRTEINKPDQKYKELMEQLNISLKYCEDDKLNDMVAEYVKHSLEWNTQIIVLSCFTKILSNKKIAVALQKESAEQMKVAEILFPDEMNRIMSKELNQIKKRIMNYWKEG